METDSSLCRVAMSCTCVCVCVRAHFVHNRSEREHMGRVGVLWHPERNSHIASFFLLFFFFLQQRREKRYISELPARFSTGIRDSRVSNINTGRRSRKEECGPGIVRDVFLASHAERIARYRAGEHLRALKAKSSR